MQVPLRLGQAFRTSVRRGLLVSLAVSTAVLTATPFLVPAVARDFDVSLGLSALISSAQLGGFMAATWSAGRWLRPTAGLIRAALILIAVANLLSALTPPFWLLLGLRVLSGLGIGIIAWAAWADVFGDEKRMGDVAVVAPFVGFVAAPLIAAVVSEADARGVFVMLGVLALVPLGFDLGDEAAEVAGPRQRRKAVPAARALLLSLFALTTGGSAVFVYAAAIGADRAGLGVGVVSVAFSLNSIASVPAARFRGRRPLGGLWLLGTAATAATIGAGRVGWLFVTALGLWGFFFWMGVPAIYRLLAERSRYPSDRAGDAQAVMAVGRVVGPALGGLMIATGSSVTLGVLGASLITVAALISVAVEVRVPPLQKPPASERS